jgi:O-antigen ligase
MVLNRVHLLDSRWFAGADLAAVLFACLLWYGWPQVGGWPLLVALLPWAIRLLAGRFPWQRTSLDLFVLFFVITAVIGVWAAYDQETAVAKFWVLLGAVLLYYALAAQPRANLWPTVALLVGIGGGLTFYFALSHDWQATPAHIGPIDRLGQWLMGLRPDLGLRPLLDNSVGGTLALLTPLALAGLWQSWRQRRMGLILLAAAATMLVLAGLFLTATRGAWLALMVALFFWLGWWGSRYQGLSRQMRLWLAAALLAAGAVGLLLAALLFPDRLIDLANALPGAPAGTSRYNLAYDTLYLVADYPWTGAGLGSFGGLYAHYILVTPFFVYSYSHNFYLDLLLEQGMFGLLSMLGMMAGIVWLLLRRPPVSAATVLLRQALLVSLLVVVVHGFVDSALYAEGGSPLLLAWAGLAVALARSETAARQRVKVVKRRRVESETAVSPQTVTIVALIITILFAIIVSGHSLLAGWHANRGAVAMDRIELAGFPAEAWDDGRRAAQLAPVIPIFEQALAYDSRQATAQYRRGLIALGQRDFETAVAHLEVAHLSQPGHRGVAKTLGYSYLWSGRVADAAVLLNQLPETPGELEAYAWWWQTQRRDDLAHYAQQLRSGE